MKARTRKIYLLVALLTIGIMLFFPVSQVLAASQGPNNPTADALRAGAGFTTPTEAYTSNDLYAVSGIDSATSHDYFTYGFTIPSGATIDGVLIEVEHKHAKSTDTGTLTLQLRNDVGNLVGTAKTGANDANTTDTYESFGGATDTWGASLTQAIINDVDFGTNIFYTKTAGGGGNKASIDHIRITVYYTAGTQLTQNDFEFWEDNDALTPTAIWGNPDIAENTALNALPPSNDPIDPADEIRIRMNITVAGTLAASTEDFILQYKEASDCTDATSWTDVDAAGGTGTWRFAASGVTDNTTLTTLLVSTSDVAGRYNKSDPTTTNPNAVTDQEFEWDWHVEYNGTATAKTYCFRMVKSPVAALDAYNADSYPRVDIRPGTGDLMRHGNFFTTGIERGFFWAN